MTTTTTYSNIVQNVQSAIYDEIHGDTTSLTFSNNETDSLSKILIISGIPEKLSETSMPMVVIDAPDITDNSLNISNNLSDVIVRARVTVYSREQLPGNIWADRIRALLRNSVTILGYKLFNSNIDVKYSNSRTSEGTPLHKFILTVGYKFGG